MVIMKLSLFDLHCDTAYELYRRGQFLSQNTLAVSLEKASQFDRYIQVMALWTPPEWSDAEGWRRLSEMLARLQEDPALQMGQARLVTNRSELSLCPQLLLSVEDARILDGQLSRVDMLFSMGVRILTPLWRGISCIGGAHDADVGLTPFGSDALWRALTLGMIPDISHASRRSADEIFSLAKASGTPVIASHSNAYELCPVSRNLTKEQIKAIRACGGIIGINLHAPFLSINADATITDILRHIDYFLSEGMEYRLALGCDMDGGIMPREIPSVDALPRLAEALLAAHYSEKTIRAIFFDNAYRFANTYLLKSHTQEGVS